MRKFAKILISISLLVIAICTVAFAAENECIIVKKVEYQNTNNVKLKEGYVKVLIGQLDFTQYAKDEYVKVTPKPDEIKTDEYGNMYAYYDMKGMLPREKLKVTIERKVKVSSFVTNEAISARANGSVTADTKLYIEPQDKIESDNQDIINKANELTEGLTTDYRKAAAFFEYVNTKLAYDSSSNYANKGAVAALKNNRGVCEEFASLFVALCRAEEIPSRIVAGYKVEEKNGEYLLIDHAWAEIYLDGYGWLPVEPTIIYTINGNRLPYWNTFCALNEANHVPTEIYNSDEGNREYQYVTEVANSYVQVLFANENIIAPAQNLFMDLDSYGWASSAIQTLYELGVVKGYSDTEYGPQRNISRIEFMTMLSRALNYMNETEDTKAKGVYYYPSYDQNHWSKTEYDFLMKCFQFRSPSDSISAGYNTIVDVFGSNANLDQAITRGEAVALMELFLGEVSTWNAFKDVSLTSRFGTSIAKAYSAGIINGYPDGTFRPNNTITRAEMACILGRMISNNTCVID